MLFIKAFATFLKAAYVPREEGIEKQTFLFMKNTCSNSFSFFEIRNVLCEIFTNIQTSAETKHFIASEPGY